MAQFPQTALILNKYHSKPAIARRFLTAIHCFRFIATDSQGGSSPLTKVTVTLCDGCTDPDHGTCDFTDSESDGEISSFYMAACDCKPGYEGK